MKLVLASILAAVCCDPAVAAPSPDPALGAHYRAIHWVGYEVYVPAINKATGEAILGVRFHLFVSAAGKPRWVLEAAAVK